LLSASVYLFSFPLMNRNVTQAPHTCVLPRPRWCLSGFLLLAVLPLVAQTTPPPKAPAPGAKEVQQLEAVEVSTTQDSGLYNRTLFRTDEDAALPYNVIDRTEIARMGVYSVDEIMRNLPEASNYGTSFQRETIQGGVTGGTTYSSSNVNLRNLGTGNTVVLINGRRLTSGASSDITRIPPSAIERIEVLPASAAAIYGGNAMGGAINFILRKDVTGADLSFNFGESTRGGAREYGGSLRYSKSFNEGNTSLSLLLSYSHRDKYTMAETPYLQRAYDRYGPGSTIRMPTGGLAFESYVLNSNTMFVAPVGYIKVDVATGTPGTSLLSGDSSKTPLGIPGSPNAWYAQFPSGLTTAQALGLNPGSFTATAGTFNATNEWRGNRTVLYVPSDLYGLTANVDHTIFKDKLFAYAELTLAYKKDEYSFPTSLGFPYGLALSATDPLNPFRTGVTPGFVGKPVRIYYDPIDIADSGTVQERHGASITLGVKGIINSRWDWTFDVNGDYARQGSDGLVPVNYLQTYLTRRGPNDPGTGVAADNSRAERLAVYHPGADHRASPIDAALAQRLFEFNRINTNYQRTSQANPRVSGQLLDLPSGMVTTQLRGEARWEQSNGGQNYTYSTEMIDVLNLTAPALSRSRASTSTSAIAGELVVPVVGREYRPIPGLKSFDLQGSFRRNWTNRGRNGNVTSVAAQAWLKGGFSVRASLSEGITPLTAAQIEPATRDTDFQVSFTDPLRGNLSQSVTVPTYIRGGNPGLKNEFSAARSFSVILRPEALGGRLSLTTIYTEIERTDTVASATVANILTFPQDYPGRLERASLTPADQAAGYTGGAITLLDASFINLARTYLETIDTRASARLLKEDHRLGSLDLIASATFTSTYITQARPNSAKINNVGSVNGTTVLGPLKWKGQVQLWWQRGRWQAGMTARYTDKYYTETTRATPAIPNGNLRDGDHIPSAVYYDFQVRHRFDYRVGQQGWRSWLSGTEMSVNIRNVLDDDPPFRSDSGTGYYSRFDDPRGRFISCEVTKRL